MLNFLFRNRSLSHALDPRKKVKIHGVTFTLRKLNPMDHLTGGQVLIKLHETYKRPENVSDIMSDGVIDKAKRHYVDVFMASVVSVRCNGIELEPSRKPPEEGERKILVEHLLTDWELAQELYASVMEFTYGKKKLKLLASPKKSLLSST